MDHTTKADLYRWCKIPRDQLVGHPLLRTKFRMVRDSAEMGQLMAEDLCQVIETNNKNGAPTRAIIPCGPNCWYGPFTNLVNTRNLSLRGLTVFHMDECLDWQGRPLSPPQPFKIPPFLGKKFLFGDKTYVPPPQPTRYR